MAQDIKSRYQELLAEKKAKSVPSGQKSTSTTDIKSRYQELLAEKQQTQQGIQDTQEKSRSLSEIISDIPTGIKKGAVSTITGIASLGERTLGSLVGAQKIGTRRDEGATSAEMLIPKRYRTPETTGEKIGFTGEQIAEFFVPGGVSVKGAKAVSALPKISKATPKIQKGVELATRAGLEAGVVGGQTALQRGKIDKEVVDAALIASVFPVVGAGLKKAKETVISEKNAARVINSLIKPLKKDFAYGKNPGLGVAKAGITANSLDTLAENISASRQKTGQQLRELLHKPQFQRAIDLTNDLSPLDNISELAAKQNNQTLLNRVQDVKRALSENLAPKQTDEGIKIVSIGKRTLSSIPLAEAARFKTEIGDMTRWTGNVSDDQAINKALKEVYGNIRNSIENSVKGIDSNAYKRLKELNEQYANLTSAEVATKYRDKLVERQDLISLKGHLLGIGGAVTAMLSTGGAAIPAIVVGATGAAMDKALASPAVKTRVARWLASASNKEKQALYEKVPVLKQSIERVFGERQPKLDKLKNASKKVKGQQESYGAIAGIEVQEDEQGNKKIGFSPQKAALGVGLMAGVGKMKGKADLLKEARKFKSANDLMKAKHPNIDFSIYEKDNEITLSKIVVPKEVRGNGAGTKAMEDLITYADIKGKRILLTPSKDYGASSVSRLTDFYKRFGFIENKGKGRDFSTRESMIREPKKPIVEAKATPSNLLQEAKKYKSAEEFVTVMKTKHRPPDADGGRPLNDLEEVFPNIYSPQGERYYGNYGLAGEKEAIRIAKSIKGNPDADITIYRSINPDEPAYIKGGDWVTIVKDYAKQHGESNLDEGYKIISKKVKAKDIFNDGNSIVEWGYRPDGHTDLSKEELIDIWNKAHGKKPIDKLKEASKKLKNRQ